MSCYSCNIPLTKANEVLNSTSERLCYRCDDVTACTECNDVYFADDADETPKYINNDCKTLEHSYHYNVCMTGGQQSQCDCDEMFITDDNYCCCFSYVVSVFRNISWFHDKKIK